jgi:hypothetical protein
MSKVVFFAASLLLVAGVAFAGIINPCGSPVVPHLTGTPCYFACPQGDTQTIIGAGFWLEFTMNDASGNPIPGISGVDFWLIDCDATKDMTLCAGSASSNADSSTSSTPGFLGKTTMSLTTLAVGGCVTGLSPVVQGVVLQQPGTIPCTTPVYCFNVKVRSCDLNGDLLMNSQDVAIFSSHYPPTGTYDTCSDFDCNTIINSQDLARLAFHYGPPQHKCQ